MSEKPSALIIGGLGYIGRFLALHIKQNDLASEVRIVDKALPEICWLAPEFSEACSKEKFMQADASKEQSLNRIFDRSNGKEWDYVFNCGGETRFSMTDNIYRLRSLELSKAVGKEAAKRGVKVFVELSTGMIYDSNSQPSKEDDKLEPRSQISHFKHLAEGELMEINGLNLVIARLACVYGDYTLQLFGTIFSMARVYQYLGEDMQWLGTGNQKLNTVHVTDVTRALWDIADWYAVKGKSKWDDKTMGKTPIFNVVDKSKTSQGLIAGYIHQNLGVKTSFYGRAATQVALNNTESLIGNLNTKTMGTWSHLLLNAGITRPTPLDPYTETEMLKIIDLSMDGSRLEEIVGFTYKYPFINKELIQSVIDSYIRIGWWPVKK